MYLFVFVDGLPLPVVASGILKSDRLTVLSGSDQCCYCTFDLMIKDVALAKFSLKCGW